ncbi:MAG: diguanylate cyclase [Chitinivibrionales bacterium]|nr:diguanylate cyclase [Chitinivibrionales bacterium]
MDTTDHSNVNHEMILAIDDLYQQAKHLIFKDRPKALELCQQALWLAESLDQSLPEHRQKRVEVQSLFGYIYRWERKYESAIELYVKAFRICESIDAPVLYAEVTERFGVIHGLIGDQPKAIEHLLMALDIYKKHNAIKNQGLCLNNLGNFFMEINELSHALEYIQEGINLIPVIDDLLHQAVTIGTLSEIYLRMTEYDHAIEWGQKSVALSKEIGAHESMVYVSLCLGEAFRKKGDYHAAQYHLNQAADQAQAHGLHGLLAKAQYNNGSVFFELKEYMKAIISINESLQTSEKIHDTMLISACFLMLSQITEEQGNFQESVLNFKKYLTSKELSFQENAQKRQKTLEVIHNLENTKKESEIKYIRNVELQKQIKKRQQIQEELEKLAITDSLTQIFNRRHFFTLAKQEFSLALTHNRALSALIADIDFFKKVNDTYGHITGDIVLSAVASQLAAGLRKVDICARYGGEEFIMLLPETNAENAFIVGERLRESVEKSGIESKNTILSVTISFGIASIDQLQQKTLDELIDHADQALYKAKKTGRNKVCIYCPEQRS